MPRKYIRKTGGPNWTEEQLKDAVLEVVKGKKKCFKVAQETGIPRSTIQKRVKHFRKQGDFDNLNKIGGQTVFDGTQEKILATVFQLYESKLLGFTTFEARKIAYDVAVKHNLHHHFNKKEELAGKDWLRGFLSRHPQLSLKKPEHTSTSRAYGFNRQAVMEFYDILEEAVTKHNILPENIFNCDETPISTVPKGSAKVIATKGTRQVGGLVASERGEHVTAMICFSATGTYVPPLIIFPRKNYNEELLHGKPGDVIAEFYPTGYMTSEIFYKWMEHFIKFTKPSAEKNVLLLLDGHTSHTKNAPALELAKNSHVIVIVFPPHCSHKLQPVDLSFNKPLSSYMTSEAITWTRKLKKKNKNLTIKNIFDIFNPAYTKAATLLNASSGFKAAGIVPFNRNIYSDQDFSCGTILDHSRIQLVEYGK